MLKTVWRRSSSPAMWAVALVLGAPALVQAQTQLFPLGWIQRQRVPCPMEDPVYGHYRHQYFGYFPTCWRSFPPGWGCPSPEAPNLAMEFQKRPRDKPPEMFPEGEEPGMEAPPGEEPGMPGERPVLPPIPGGQRSPFDLDQPRATPDAPGEGGVAPRPERATPPGAMRGAPPAPAPAAPSVTAGGNGNESTAPLLALPEPAEAPTTAMPPAPGLDPQRGNGTPTEAPGAPTSSNLPPPGLGRPAMNPSPNPMSTAAANALAPTAGAPVAMPVQAPQRRGPLSTLFSGLSGRMRR